MDLARTIAECQEHFEKDPPPNEASTCEWVILPLLHASGYAKKEVLARNADSDHKFPDYTLLPNDPKHLLYLEAKAWSNGLKDHHANQALNYANQNGKRWVLLTNGRVWRLYDNDVRGLAEAKLAVEAKLEDTEASLRFFKGISRDSVRSGRLSKFVLAEKSRQARRALLDRLSSVLEGELADEGSLLVKAMAEELRKRDELDAVTPADITSCLSGREEPPTLQPPQDASVLVIPARIAWPEYQAYSAYICQPNRHFRPTSHLAFYAEGCVQAAVPKIVDTIEAVGVSEEGIAGLKSVSEPTRARLEALFKLLMSPSGGPRAGFHKGQTRKIVLLSSPDSPDTIRLPHPIRNDLRTKNGRPWAFVVGQRYVSLPSLLAAPERTSGLLGQ